MAGLVWALVAGCPASRNDREPDAAVDAGPVDAGFDAGQPELRWSLRVRIADGGQWLGLDVPDSGAAIELEPASALELVGTAPLRDFRLRLFDWRDAVVVSDETIAVDDAGTRWLVEPARALASGRSYTIRLEAQRGDAVVDELGRSWPDWELPLRVLGELEPEPKPAKRRRR